MPEIGRVVLNEFPLILYQGLLSHQQVCTGRMEAGAENKINNLICYINDLQLLHNNYFKACIIILRNVQHTVQIPHKDNRLQCIRMVCCTVLEREALVRQPILVPIYFIYNRKQSEVIKALSWFYSCRAQFHHHIPKDFQNLSLIFILPE